jgi:PAS domain S-box-containing protein
MDKSLDPFQILENMPEGVFAINQDCRITFFNLRAEAITGYTRQQVLGKVCYEVFRPEICQTTCSIKKSMKTGKESFDHQVNILDRSNRARSIRIQTSPLRDEEGHIVGGLQSFHVIDRPDEEVRQELILFELRKKMGRDRRLAKIYEILPDLAKSDAPVLLQGEPGTGKRLLANAIHRLSGRAKEPFLQVSCKQKTRDQLTEELLGSNMTLDKEELTREEGILERAHRGTVFVEGIEDLPYSLQESLFRAMEEGIYMPVGTDKAVDTDIRLIASSESNLEEKVKEGTFRENLFHCLNVFKVYVPPLRDRREDITILAQDILWHLSLEKGGEVYDIDDKTGAILQAYPYPRNLEDLRVVLEKAYREAQEPRLKPEDLPSFVFKESSETAGWRKDQRLGREHALGQQRNDILDALIRNRWNRTRAARELGMDRTTLWRKMKRMGIQNTATSVTDEKDRKRSG